MGLSKKTLFTEQQNQIALYAKVLGHPARVAILHYLFEVNTCICGDLVGKIGLAQPTVSQHLKELKQVGLIKGRVEGTSVCYCVDAKGWATLKDVMFGFLDQDAILSKSCC